MTTLDANAHDDATDPTIAHNTQTTTALMSSTTFNALGLLPVLCDVCISLGYSTPTSIQAQAIPLALQGRDLIALAQTGSGKTAAFLLPFLQALLQDKQAKCPYGVVLSPTRELAIQIAEQAEALGGASVGLRVATLVGGVDMVTQAIGLSKKPHLIIATPGRLVDHLENTKGFTLKNSLKYLVLDEADRLLNMDFEEALDKILRCCPPSRTSADNNNNDDDTKTMTSTTRQTLLFSATMTNKVAKLQRASLNNPVRIEVSSKYSTASTLLQHYLFIPARLKDVYLIYLLNEFSGSNTCMIFVNSCRNVQRLAVMARLLGFGAVPIHGQLTQPKRLAALGKFKAGERNILIATDVASRGLDIPSVDLVINFDLPQHSKDYIHRVGRTARAGRAGKSLTLITQYDIEAYQRIEALLGKQLPEYEVDKEAIAIITERVQEAQRQAQLKIKEMDSQERHSRKDRKRTKPTKERSFEDH